jgi:hypothetical protein
VPLRAVLRGLEPAVGQGKAAAPGGGTAVVVLAGLALLGFLVMLPHLMGIY